MPEKRATRRAVLVLLVFTGLGLWWIARPPTGSEPTTPPARTPTTARPAMTTPSSTTSTTSPAAADSGHDVDQGEEGRQEVESYHQRLADPAQSDLPPALFTQLTDLGTRVQLAYLTSQGGTTFPATSARIRCRRSGPTSASTVRARAPATVAPTQWMSRWFGRAAPPTEGLRFLATRRSCS